jgi:hypothetical protein
MVFPFSKKGNKTRKIYMVCNGEVIYYKGVIMETEFVTENDTEWTVGKAVGALAAITLLSVGALQIGRFVKSKFTTRKDQELEESN